jgi:tetratricopeptide (TPR) repeat protein
MRQDVFAEGIMPVSRLEQLRERFSQNPRRYFAPFANELRKGGDFEQAIAICRVHLATQPGHISGHIVLAQALFDSGNYTEAEQVFQAALALDPENLIALRSLGDIAVARGDLTRARSWYERVLETDARNQEIVSLIRALDEGHAVDLGSTSLAEPAGPDAPSLPAGVEGGGPLAGGDQAGLQVAADEPSQDVLPRDPLGGGESAAPQDEPEGGGLRAAAVAAQGEVHAESPDAAVRPRRPTPAAAYSDPEAAPDEWFELDFSDSSAAAERLPGLAMEEWGEETQAASSQPSELEVGEQGLQFSEEDRRWLSPPTPAPPASPTASEAGGAALELNLELAQDLAIAAAAEELTAAREAVAEEIQSAQAGLAGVSSGDVGAGAATSPGAEPESLRTFAEERRAADAALEEEVVEGPALATETLAELYLQQGFRKEALLVYREVLARDPGNTALAERVAALEQEVQRQGESLGAPRQAAGAVAVGMTASQFFAGIARRKRRSAAAGRESPAEGVSAPQESLGDLFGDVGASSGDAAAAERLSSLFGSRTGSVAAGGGELSLGRLFGDVSSGRGDASPPPGNQGASRDPDMTDLNEFRAWLENLRRK